MITKKTFTAAVRALASWIGVPDWADAKDAGGVQGHGRCETPA